MQNDQVLKPDPEDLRFGNRDFHSAQYHAFGEHVHQVFKRIADCTYWKVCRTRDAIVEFSQVKIFNGAFVPMDREES